MIECIAAIDISKYLVSVGVAFVAFYFGWREGRKPS